ncbi:MAG: thioredoxin-like domain-containing protein, partial [Saprospiraceae bacterium]
MCITSNLILSIIVFLNTPFKYNSKDSIAIDSNNFRGSQTDPIHKLKSDNVGNSTDITIRLKDITASGKVNIIGFYLDQNFLADTLNSTDGVIHYKKDKAMDQGLYYFSIPGRKDEYVQVFIGEDQEFEMTALASDLFNSMEIKGSEENSLFYENIKFESPIQASIGKINNELKNLKEDSPEYRQLKSDLIKYDNQRMSKIKELYNKYPKSLFVNFKNGGQNPKLDETLSKEAQLVKFRNEFWDNVNFSDERLLHTVIIGNKLKRFFKDLTPQNQDSIIQSAHMLMQKVIHNKEYFKAIANWITLTYEPGKCPLMDAEAVFVFMVQNYFTKEKAFWQDSLSTSVIQKRAFEMSHCLLGQQGPNVISVDPLGNSQELYTMKADYLIVYMYNPECEHCQEETPKLHKYYLEHKDSVDVFAIAIQTNDEKWKNYINKN